MNVQTQRGHAARCETASHDAATYSKFHGKWIVENPEKPAIIIGSGDSKGEAERKASAYIAMHIPWLT
jgi:hypothetical protein